MFLQFVVCEYIKIDLGEDQRRVVRTFASLVQGQDEVIYRLALRADLSVRILSQGCSSHSLEMNVPQVDSCACEGRSANIVSIFLLFVVQGVKVRFDRERDDGRRVICEILLERGVIHCVLDHVGGRFGGECLYGRF